MIANDNDAARALARVYQTRQGADSAALKLAIDQSPTRRARRVLFANTCYTATEGGAAYEAHVLPEGYGVREVPAAELARRVQSGLRREIDRLLEAAQFSAAREKELIALGKPASDCFVRMRHREATEYRSQARELETLVVLDLARAV